MRRMYEVHFEWHDGSQWQRNWSKRTVAIQGGAEAAITEATKREKRAQPTGRIRVEEVRLIGEEG